MKVKNKRMRHPSQLQSRCPMITDENTRILIRRLYFEDNISIHQIAKKLSIGRNTVRHWIRCEEPKPRPVSESMVFLHSKLDELKGLFVECRGNCVVFKRNIEELYGQTIPLRTLQRFVSGQELRTYYRQQRDEGMPTRYETEPGYQMQIDFGNDYVIMNGEKVPVHIFVAILGYSRRIFIKAYPIETTSSWLDGIESAMKYYGGRTLTIVSDNSACLVRNARASKGEDKFTERYWQFCSFHGVKPIACTVQKPRSKGKVEAAVKYAHKNAFAGRISFNSFEELNLYLEHWAKTYSDERQLKERFLKGLTPRERFVIEREALLACRAGSYATLRLEDRKVNNDGLIRVDNLMYKFPAEYRGQDVQVLIDAKSITAMRAGRTIAVFDKARDNFIPETQGLSNKPTQVVELNTRVVPHSCFRRNPNIYNTICNFPSAENTNFVQTGVSQ